MQALTEVVLHELGVRGAIIETHKRRQRGACAIVRRRFIRMQLRCHVPAALPGFRHYRLLRYRRW